MMDFNIKYNNWVFYIDLMKGEFVVISVVFVNYD